MASAFKNAIKAGIGSVPQVCYTAPAAGTATVIGCSIANLTDAIVYADIILADSSAGVSAHIGKQLMVPVRGTLVVSGGEQKLVLEANDTISISSSAAASVDAIISLMEVS